MPFILKKVSEVVKLKTEDIDAERKLIHIKEAKGRKYRYTLLSDIALVRRNCSVNILL